MTYPPAPSGGWNDPAWPGQQPSPPADPTLQMSAPPANPDPYATGQPVPGQPAGTDPYLAGGYPPAGYPAGGYPPPGYPAYGYASAPKTNSLAIAALVLALVGIASCITAPVGAILGHVARRQIRERGEGGEGMAKAAIIVGWILTVLMVLLIIFYVVIIVLAVANSDSTSTY